ncbi:hypothetical protein [Jiangella sp. DSM 45060]|uniref:hypothetical protein n=1 Tax=Jiangella sp. DSM 45060 TaxID=1798224 RepID=UPI00087931AB|nr:hypothetical protein [Jiangella sp. DSM 45060]SDT69395.1 hypothetical protein SAMN04515669_6015 [Jiangella sp. DSM 45060]
MSDPTQLARLVDVVVDDLDRMRGLLDSARVTLAAAVDVVDNSKTGLTALRDQLGNRSAR